MFADRAKGRRLYNRVVSKNTNELKLGAPVPSINSSLHEIGELVLVYLTPECRRLRLGRLRNAT